MKSIQYLRIVLMVICLTCFSFTKLSAHNGCESSSVRFENLFEKVTEDKHYVKPGSVLVSANEIFLCIEGLLFPVALVESDGAGVFVRSNAFIWGRCPLCNMPLNWFGNCVNIDCSMSLY